MAVDCRRELPPQALREAEATPRKLLDLCGSDDSSPRSTCSSGSGAWSGASTGTGSAGSSPSSSPSSTPGSAAGSAACWPGVEGHLGTSRTLQPSCHHSSAEEVGEAGQQESDPEEEEVDAVSRHLHNMNVASDEVNALQQELASQQRDRAALERLWAVGSARLARSRGFSRPWKTQQRQRREHRCLAAKQAALEASSRYLSAVDAGLADEQLARLLQEHEACLAEYRALAPKSGEVPQALQLLCEAECEHRSQVSELDAAIEQLSGQLAVAKAKYRDAMNSLQEISDSIHLRRASPKAAAPFKSSGQDQSVPQASPGRSKAALR